MTTTMAATLPASVAYHATVQPWRPALICGARQLTYVELDRRSTRLAHSLLADGIGPSSRIAHLAHDSELYYEILLACAKIGAVMVPIDWRLTALEVEHILRDSRTELVFVEPALAQLVAGITTAEHLDAAGLAQRRERHQTDGEISVAAGRDTPIVQIYTSGTTGAPKGVVLAHRTFFAIAESLAGNDLDWIDWRSGDRSLLGVPGFHVGGLWWATQGLNAGITNVVLPAFDSRRARDVIRNQRITTTCMVPAMLRAMLDEPDADASDFTTLRKVVYGGSPISEALLVRCAEVLDCDLVQIYGLTETGNTAVCLPPEQHRSGSSRLAAAGRPYPGVQVKVIDDDGADVPTGSIGQVCLNTPAHMLEYFNQPVKTASTLIDGWVHTGDAGYLDHEGYLYICDRISETIIVGGENVYPAEVENALCAHPDVREAAVVASPDPVSGERVHAFVVLRNGNTVTGFELTAFIRSSLAQFKIPAVYDFIDAVPRTPSGKVLRRTLRERLWTGMTRKVN